MDIYGENADTVLNLSFAFLLQRAFGSEDCLCSQTAPLAQLIASVAPYGIFVLIATEDAG